MNKNTLKCNHKKHENMQHASQPTPSGLPLQGSGGFIRASLDLSSSRGVCLPRKGKKIKEREKKNHKPVEGEEALCPTLLID